MARPTVAGMGRSPTARETRAGMMVIVIAVAVWVFADHVNDNYARRSHEPSIRKADSA